MLVLTRQADESITIDGAIEVTVLGIKGQRVKLGVSAPDCVRVHRSELQQFADEFQSDEECLPAEQSCLRSSYRVHDESVRERLVDVRYRAGLLQTQLRQGAFCEADETMDELLHHLWMLDEAVEETVGESAQLVRPHLYEPTFANEAELISAV